MGNPANFGPAQLGFWLHLGKKQVGKSMAQARPELSAFRVGPLFPFFFKYEKLITLNYSAC
jgi:hypothetical protein